MMIFYRFRHPSTDGRRHRHANTMSVLVVYKFVYGPLKKHVGHTYGFASSRQMRHRQMVDFPQFGHGKETADSLGMIGR
ncbi:MAG: hypothetical protein QXF45_01130 [Candidatus Caldarchaeum sp.]